MATIGIIGALVVIFWYYYAADKLGKNAAAWTIGGAMLYAGTRRLWTYGIVAPLMGQAFYHHTGLTGLAIEASGIIIAIIVVVAVKLKYLRAPKPDQQLD